MSKDKPPKEPDDVYSEVLNRPYWPRTLEARKTYSRQHDDCDGGNSGVLKVMFGDDGDAYVMIDYSDGLRFRTFAGGGSSLRVRNALLVLAEAIRQDNEERPQTR